MTKGKIEKILNVFLEDAMFTCWIDGEGLYNIPADIFFEQIALLILDERKTSHDVSYLNYLKEDIFKKRGIELAVTAKGLEDEEIAIG